tara:strand:- start:228 stop:413 length:186 start_codon:yes stop_codon:yes gene_type:complete
MPDDIEIVDALKKIIASREAQIAETLMSGGLKDMEHYKYLQGELSALYYIKTELQNLFKQN